MSDNNNNKDDEFDSILKKEGIIIENKQPQNEEESIEKLKTEEVEKELFNAIGAEIKKTIELDDEPITDDVKEELNKGGIEVLPPEPLDDNDRL